MAKTQEPSRGKPFVTSRVKNLTLCVVFTRILTDVRKARPTTPLTGFYVPLLPKPQHDAAFAVTDAGAENTGKGIELLHFLAQVVAHQLDTYLKDLAI
jgi:hypothetical protein